MGPQPDSEATHIKASGMWKCIKCSRETPNEPMQGSKETLCDECFDELDKKFAPIAEWLGKPEVQAAIEADIAKTECPADARRLDRQK
jgi:hypothetical protein